MIDMPLPQAARCTSFDNFRLFMAAPVNREAVMVAFEVGC